MLIYVQLNIDIILTTTLNINCLLSIKRALTIFLKYTKDSLVFSVSGKHEDLIGISTVLVPMFRSLLSL